MAPVSAIKLIRTDTTLDLSQKAEKGMTVGVIPVAPNWVNVFHRSYQRGHSCATWHGLVIADTSPRIGSVTRRGDLL